MGNRLGVSTNCKYEEKVNEVVRSPLLKLFLLFYFFDRNEQKYNKGKKK
jgi:hypothetical protein